MRIDPYLIRKDFPYFQSPEGATIYLDNAATTQKPICVLNAMQDVYIHSCANIHRGNHRLARSAEAAYQQARETVRRFLNARESCEIIFTGGATDSVNLLSQAYCQRHLLERSNLVVTALEHHSNFIPWQQRCRETGAELRIVPVSSSGILDKEEWNRMIDGDTALAVVTGMSNAIGCRLPLEELIQTAHAKGVPVLVDASQLIAHRRIDVQKLGCDFLVFSGHKLYGPQGIGVLYGKREFLQELPPPRFGGGMIERLDMRGENIYQQLPGAWEAGTPNIAGAAGLASAMTYLESIGMDAIEAHEAELIREAWTLLVAMPGVRLLGAESSVISFLIDGISPYDAGVFLDFCQIAVRCSAHCAHPLMHALGISATIRASFCLYNTKEDVQKLAEAVSRLCRRIRKEGMPHGDQVG